MEYCKGGNLKNLIYSSQVLFDEKQVNLNLVSCNKKNCHLILKI
jgi:hypothetical protein